MKVRYMFFMIVLLLSACAAKSEKKPQDGGAAVKGLLKKYNLDLRKMSAIISDPQVFIGDWAVVQGDTESVTFSKSGEYYSYLHSRPFYTGKWTIKNNQLRVDQGNNRWYNYQKIYQADKGGVTYLLLLKKDGSFDVFKQRK